MNDVSANDVQTVSAPASPVAVGDGRLRRWVRDDRAWLIAALVMNLLLGWGGDEASSLAWLNPLLFVAALVVRSADRRRGPARVALSGWVAAIAIVAIGWIVGMIVELTIAAGGDGYGGMHADTGPSFVLAQGYYLPAALFTWAAVRRYGLDTRRAFFFAGTMAWWETVTLGAVALLSPAFVIAPLLIAYYFSTYALCGMAGLLVVDAAGVAGRSPRSISDRRLLAYGTVAGAVAWGVFMGWAVLSSRLFDFAL